MGRRSRSSRSKSRRKASAAKNNPWTAGAFYTVAFIVILAAIAGLAVMMIFRVSLRAAVTLSAVLIITLLAIGVVGAVQLRANTQFSSHGFFKRMLESYKRLPLFRAFYPDRPLMKGEEED